MARSRRRQGEPRDGQGAAQGFAEGSAQGFRLADFLPYRLSVTTNRISRAFAARYSERLGLSIPEWRVLAVLGSYAPLSSNEVCERTAMDKAKVSRAVAQLARKGLLDRASHPDDQRLLRLSLSRRGQATFETVIPIAQQLEAELTSELSAEERSVLARCLDRLGAAVARIAADDPGGGAPVARPRRNSRMARPFSGHHGQPEEAAMTAKQRNEGEGSKSADRHYREKTRDFIEKGEVEKKAKEAAREIDSPNQPLSAAEKIGRERAAEEDPRVSTAGKKPR